jgi:single-strand DNA-binding protein
MAKSLNKWIGVGTIGRDAETTQVSANASVTKFSLATNYSYKKGDEWVEETDWHNVVAWNKSNLSQYLVKGTKICVEGRYTTRSYQDKNGDRKYVSEVVCDNIVLLSSNGGGQKQSPSQVSAGGFQDDDDTPF